MDKISSYLNCLPLPLNALFSSSEKLVKQQKHQLSCLSEIQKAFPHLNNTLFGFILQEYHTHILQKVGVVFSGGQASGGHNVIAGLYHAVKKANPSAEILGFLKGPQGLIDDQYRWMDDGVIEGFLNTGGFDLLGSGRTKIETDEQKKKVLEVAIKHKLDALVIIGGDDSNTNAAILAEYFLQNGLGCAVIGVPKTIDGDLKNPFVQVSFGFDSAAKLFSELIGNIERDALSAKKYTHFIKIMGRSASHLALESALMAKPNYVFIIEEVIEKKWGLKEAVSQLANLIESRANLGKNYGVIVIPEGLIEAFYDVQALLKNLEILIKQSGKEKAEAYLNEQDRSLFESIPESIRKQLLNETDPHGNIQVSLIETEKLLAEMTKIELLKRGSKAKFSPICHFFGYEGRCCYPTYFDALYSYYLGIGAFVLAQNKLSGYMVCITHLDQDYLFWDLEALPIVALMHMETRKGILKPVIKKALVNLHGTRFSQLEKYRKTWEMDDHYAFVPPVQYFGPKELIFRPPLLIEDIP